MEVLVKKGKFCPLYTTKLLFTFDYNKYETNSENMKKCFAILSLLFLFSCGNKNSDAVADNPIDAAKEKASEMTNGATDNSVAASTDKKYDSKSGIVTIETTASVSGMTVKTKQVLYFDDYGRKECQEQFVFDQSTNAYVLDTKDLVKDGFRYIISTVQKTGMKTKAQGSGVAAKFDMDEAATMKDMKFKKIGDETICGKVCNCFSRVTPSGNITMFGWNKIVLKTITDNPEMKMKTVAVATKIEENVSMPSDKFEIPKDVKLTDY